MRKIYNFYIVSMLTGLMAMCGCVAAIGVYIYCEVQMAASEFGIIIPLYNMQSDALVVLVCLAELMVIAFSWSYLSEKIIDDILEEMGIES